MRKFSFELENYSEGAIKIVLFACRVNHKAGMQCSIRPIYWAYSSLCKFMRHDIASRRASSFASFLGGGEVRSNSSAYIFRL